MEAIGCLEWFVSLSTNNELYSYFRKDTLRLWISSVCFGKEIAEVKQVWSKATVNFSVFFSSYHVRNATTKWEALKKKRNILVNIVFGGYCYEFI